GVHRLHVLLVARQRPALGGRELAVEGRDRLLEAGEGRVVEGVGLADRVVDALVAEVDEVQDLILVPPDVTPRHPVQHAGGAQPTRDTEMPTLRAGRTPELNSPVSRKICPSVIEMTLVGM